MSALQILDFTPTPVGTVVTRSAHWVEDRGGSLQGQLGIVVDKEFHQDTTEKVICWPVVHWENEPMAHQCHPANVTPFRAHELQTIEMTE